MTLPLLVATRNPGKIRELADIVSSLDIEWIGLDGVGIETDVEEDGATFKDNAIKKALTYAGIAGMLTLADDSGLEVDALGGKPGVHTARYGGAALSSVQRYERLLGELAGVAPGERGARFRCVIALARPGQLIDVKDGVCEGAIANKPAGVGGFGYDPIFYLAEYRKTMAQLDPEIKNKISHRGRAMRAMAPTLRNLLEAP